MRPAGCGAEGGEGRRGAAPHSHAAVHHLVGAVREHRRGVLPARGGYVDAGRVSAKLRVRTSSTLANGRAAPGIPCPALLGRLALLPSALLESGGALAHDVAGREVGGRLARGEPLLLASFEVTNDVYLPLRHPQPASQLSREPALAPAVERAGGGRDGEQRRQAGQDGQHGHRAGEEAAPLLLRRPVVRHLTFAWRLDS